MKYIQGFNLIELMITLTIAIILVLIALPSFNSYIANQRSNAISTSLLAALHYARSEAIRQNNVVSVCPIKTGTASTCDTTPTSDWSNGWIVWVPTTSAIIRHYPPVQAQAIKACLNPVQFNAVGSLVVQTNCDSINNSTICPTSHCQYGAFLVKPANCSNGYQINIEPFVYRAASIRVPCP
jgi:prepilin-type N-terminal cleavage/methylation domain-containing protein